ncbi:MAG: hypothetical protein IPL62_05475 [Caulobacteraceae bacterium]|nr:hypothetical protein [Caulobacteraceae bacterium]
MFRLFRRIFAEGAFSQAFIPVYSKTLAAEGEEAANRMASEALSILLLTTVVLSAVAHRGMPWIKLAHSPATPIRHTSPARDPADAATDAVSRRHVRGDIAFSGVFNARAFPRCRGANLSQSLPADRALLGPRQSRYPRRGDQRGVDIRRSAALCCGGAVSGSGTKLGFRFRG